MKKLLASITFIFAFLCMITSVTSTQAAAKLAPPKSVTVKEGAYYDYWNKHRSELKKKGINQGDICDAVISWNKVSSAKGYLVKVYWKYDDGWTETSVINVKKINNKKYKFTSKDYGTWGNTPYHCICKDTKTFITNPSEKYSFTGSKLSFHIRGGCPIEVQKVVIKSYKTVKGKKVYSKAYTKNIKHNYR